MVGHVVILGVGVTYRGADLRVGGSMSDEEQVKMEVDENLRQVHHH